MREALYYASQELKRAEHLMYVSLKYTRTADVIRSLIARIIASFDFIIDGIIEQIEEKNYGLEMPTTPFGKVTLLKKEYKDDHKMWAFLDFYVLLRKMSRDTGEGTREFRRNLKLTKNIDGQEIEITIDISEDYYKRALEFLHYVRDTHLLDEE